MKIGIDAGGTLIKVAYLDELQALHLSRYALSQMDEVISWIEGYDSREVCLTGGKAALMKSLLGKVSDEMPEFEATSRGARYLLQRQNFAETEYMITNVGTGTSIHHVDKDRHERIGGTGVGGGTLLGLSYLLTGITDYETLVNLAAQGKRDRIDLTVGQIYEGAEPPIPADLTASNFGNPLLSLHKQPLAKEDVLATVVGLVGETIATTSVHAAGQCGADTIIFIGSSFVSNPLLKDVVERYTILRGANPVFLENGAFSGAIGALLKMNPTTG